MRHLVDGAQVVGHELRPGGAVQPHRQQLDVLKRRHQRVGSLPGEHRPHRLDRARNHHRHAIAQLLEHFLHADQAGLDVAGVLRGFEQQDVGAALDQSFRLVVVVLAQLVEGDAAGDRDGLRRRPHRARDESRLVRGREFFSGLAGELGGREVDVVSLGGQSEILQVAGGGVERIARDDIGTGLEIRRVNIENHVGAGQDQVVVAALVFGTAEVLCAKLARLDHRAHGAVEHQNALFRGRFQQFCTIFPTLHKCSPGGTP